MSNSETDTVIQEFLGTDPRATEWRAMRQALQARLDAIRQEWNIETRPERKPALAAQISQMEKQITALGTEEAVTQFIEDSIKVALARPSLSDPEDEEG